MVSLEDIRLRVVANEKPITGILLVGVIIVTVLLMVYSTSSAIGLLPFGVIAAGVLAVGLAKFLTSLTGDDVTLVLTSVATIWLIVIMALVFVTQMCARITVVELFDTATDSFGLAIVKAESDVCALVDHVNTFIASDVGQPGQDNPSILKAAQNKAAAATMGPNTVCPGTELVPVDMNEAADRISRIERTLNLLVEPEFKATYDKSMVCEGFDSDSDPDSDSDSDSDPDPNQDEAEIKVHLTVRLNAAQTTIKRLTTQYLDPIQQKQKDLQAGIASDCDKKKGATTAVTGQKPP